MRRMGARVSRARSSSAMRAPATHADVDAVGHVSKMDATVGRLRHRQGRRFAEEKPGGRATNRKSWWDS